MSDEIWNARSGKMVVVGQAEGVILAQKPAQAEVLCMTIDGDLFVTDLTSFEIVDGESDLEVQPGDVIRVEKPRWIMGPGPLRTWLKS
jgi:hypothetical protein